MAWNARTAASSSTSASASTSAASGGRLWLGRPRRGGSGRLASPSSWASSKLQVASSMGTSTQLGTWNLELGTPSYAATALAGRLGHQREVHPEVLAEALRGAQQPLAVVAAQD